MRFFVLLTFLFSIVWGECYPKGWDRTVFPGHTPGGWMNPSVLVALKKDGRGVVWGDPSSGGMLKTIAPPSLENIKAVYSTVPAFAALREDGTVVTWGDPKYGGDSSNVQDKLYNVKTIFSTIGAFAALKDDGAVVTWGDARYGGDSSNVQDKLYNVKTIFSNWKAFAAQH